MKNVLIYLNPSGEFDKERAILARIQIDNSLSLGWKPEDMLLVTNFPYEYNGIKALVIDGAHFCAVMPRSTNTVTVPHLFDLKLIEPGETYWVHDFDAYQLNHFCDEDLGMGDKDLGLTTYGWSPKWCLGSFYFRQGAKDIFEWIKESVYYWKLEDERALRALTRGDYQGINSRYKELNITFNFGMRNVASNYAMADLPLRVLHFHPFYFERGLMPLRIFMYGENPLGFPLINDRLIRIFHDHGF